MDDLIRKAAFIRGALFWALRVLLMLVTTAGIVWVTWGIAHELVSRCLELGTIALLLLILGGCVWSLTGKHVCNWVRQRLVKKSALHVFWTMTEQGLMLAMDMARKDARVNIEFRFFSEPEMDAFKRRRLILMAESVHATWRFFGVDDLSDDADLQIKERMIEGESHYFFGSNGSRNLSLAKRIAEMVEQSPSGKKEKSFYLRLEYADDVKEAKRWGDQLCGKGRVDPIVISEAELVARQFALAFSPLRHDGICVDYETSRIVSGQCRTLLIGYDEFGRKIAEYLFPSTQFMGVGDNLVTFPLTIVDKDESRFGHVKMLVEQGAPCIEFKVAKLRSEEFSNWLRQNINRFDRIVINLPDDASCLREAIAIRNDYDLGGRVKILVRVSDPTILIQTKDADGLITFGAIQDLYTSELIRDDQVDVMAKLVHATWSGVDWTVGTPTREDWGRINEAWRRAELYERQSSRASALGAMNTLRLLGYECVAPDESIGEDDLVCTINSEWAARNKLSRAAIEVLSRNEHLRWWQYMRWSGYATWDLQNPSLTDDSVEKKANQKAYGKHAAMIDYDRLPWLDAELAKANGLKAQDGSELTPDYFADKDEVGLSNGSYRTMQGRDVSNVQDVYEKILVSGMNVVKLRRRDKATVGVLRDLASSAYDHDKAEVAEGFAPDASFLDLVNQSMSKVPGLVFFSFPELPPPIGKEVYVFDLKTGMVLPRCYVKDLRRFAEGFRLQPRFAAQIQKKGDETYVSFAGTDCILDWVENAEQCLGRVPPQYILAAELLRLVIRKTRGIVHVVGHSEGGGEVQYSLLKNKSICEGRVFGCTFNSQRLSEKILTAFDKETQESVERVTVNFRIPWDVVSGWRPLGEHLLGPVLDFHGKWEPKNLMGILGAKVAHSLGSFARIMAQK